MHFFHIRSFWGNCINMEQAGPSRCKLIYLLYKNGVLCNYSLLAYLVGVSRSFQIFFTNKRKKRNDNYG